MPYRSHALTQALRLQQLAMTSAETIGKDLQETKDKELRAKQAQALSSIIKAFDTLEDRKRILKGKPMPGSLRPEAKQKRKSQKHASPIEIVEFKEQGEPKIEGPKESISASPAKVEGAGGE